MSCLIETWWKLYHGHYKKSEHHTVKLIFPIFQQLAARHQSSAVPLCTTIDIAVFSAALDEALDVPVALLGIDDHLFARKLLRQQRLCLIHLQVGPDELGSVRVVSTPLLGQKEVVSLPRRARDWQSEANCDIALIVVLLVAKVESLFHGNRGR